MNSSLFKILSIFITLNCASSTIAYCTGDWFANVTDSALNLYQAGKYSQAIDMVKSDSNYRSNATSLNFIGKCFWDNYQYDSAQAYFERAEENISDDLYGYIYSQLGQIDYALVNERSVDAINLYLELRKTLKTRDIPENLAEIKVRRAELTFYTNRTGYEKSILEVLNTIPDNHPEKFRIFISYLDYIWTSDLSKVDSILQAASLHLQKHFPEHKSKICQLKLAKAVIAISKGKLHESTRIFESEVYPLLQGKEEYWARFLTGEYHRFRGYAYGSVGDFIKKGESLQNYIKIAKTLYDSNHHRISESYRDLANLYLELGRTELATSYMDKSIKILEQSGKYRIDLRTFRAGLTAFQNGDFLTSQSMFEKHILADDEFGDLASTKSIANFHLATLAFMKEDFKSAQSYIDKCTNISTRGLDYTDIYGMKYKILRKSGQAAESNAVLAKILPMIDSLGTKSLNPHIQFLNDYIQYQIDDGDFQQALKYVDLILTDNDEVIKENSTVYNPELKRILVQSLYLKGQIFEKLYQRNSINTHIERAHKSYLSGIKALNEVKRAYKSERDRQNNIEQLKKIYRSGIRTSHVLYELTGEDRYLQNAFSFAESYLSNQLLEDLSRNLSIQQTNIPDSLLLQLRNLRLQESHLMSEIAILKGMRVKSQEDSTMLETYLFTLTENKNAYNTALRYLELNFPEFYGVNYDAKLVSIDKIRNKLSPSEALIEYFITEDAVFVFSISRDQAAFLKLPVPDIENILLFKSLMQEADNSDIESATRFREVSRRVYDQVLHKALTAIDNDAINKLYIIPDGELNLIPFELFMTSKTEDSNEDFGSLPYLIKDFNISYAHSSSVLFHQSERSPSGNVYFKAFAPSYNPEKNSAHKSYKRGDAWSELAFNEAEAKKLSDYFQGRVFTTSSATEKSFVQNHKGATILHMAMHANVDMENPQLSKLVFSAVNDSIFDNYLHSFEIYNMDINTQLTVLSACRTGAGNLANGEGVMSLARAFTYAGSRAVIMSHWQVDDQSTNELMNAFYKHLSEGQSKSKALQLAKIDYLKTASPNKQHPFFWSAFVMIGDDQPIGTTGDMPWHYLLIVIPGIYFIGLMYFKVKKVVR